MENISVENEKALRVNLKLISCNFPVTFRQLGVGNDFILALMRFNGLDNVNNKPNVKLNGKVVS